MKRVRWIPLILGCGLTTAALGLSMVSPPWILGQPKSTNHEGKVDHSLQHAGEKLAAPKELVKQIEELQGKVIQLKAVIDRAFPGESSHTGGSQPKTEMGTMMQNKGMGMKMMGGKGMGGDNGMDQMMNMMNMMMQMKMMQMVQKRGDMVGMEKMSGGMGMNMKMMGGSGMTMMGGTHAKGRMQSSSALPGFPGASHIYHVGATGFFLDHPQHITLSADQQAALNQFKERALLQQESYGRKIEEAEKELFVLTGSDQPDASKIEAKVREIEKLGGDKRLAFIHAVGDAAKILTEDHRKILLGFVSSKVDESDHANHKKGVDEKSN